MSVHGAVNQYTQNWLAYVHGGNAFRCAHMSLHTYCNNVSMCVQCHGHKLIVQDRMVSGVCHISYVEDSDKPLLPMLMLKACGGKSHQKLKTDYDY